MTILEITMPYGKVVKIEYDLNLDEVKESFEKLFEYQDRLTYIAFPENTERKKMIIPVDVFKQCIMEFYDA